MATFIGVTALIVCAVLVCYSEAVQWPSVDPVEAERLRDEAFPENAGFREAVEEARDILRHGVR